MLGGNCLPYIKDRANEGYGLNNEAMKKFAGQGVKLIITVDCGIVNTREVELANTLGIDIIITDHHQKGKKIPKASAIIHDDSLVGASIAWLLAEGLRLEKLNKKLPLNQNWDLAAIGTIADLQPLVGKNRSFVKWGLEKLNKTKRLGLQVLVRQANLQGKKLKTYHVGFIIAPRLNASGRLKNALSAVRLLCTRNRSLALKIAGEISQLNIQRQNMTL